MEINSKQLMIGAAIVAGAWYFLRKKPAASMGGGSGGGSSAINGLGNLFSGLGGSATVNTKPLQVPAETATPTATTGSTKPLQVGSMSDAMNAAGSYLKPLVVGQPAPVAPAASGAVWGGTVAGAAPAITTSVTPSDAYAFGHLSQEQRGGKTDGQLALSIMGY